MILDLTADANRRKTMVLEPNYPQDVTKTVIKGNTESATFTVAIGEPGKPEKYTYQWYVNDAAVEGATDATFIKSDLSSTATYTVYCEVTNPAGTVKSRVATLAVTQYYTPVLNTSYPADATKTVVKGNTTSATFSVSIATAGVPASYTYQWYVNGTAVSGATSASYTKSDLSTTATYSVYCVVTNAAGTVTSRTATLKVTQYYTPVLNTSYPANVTKTVIKGNTVSATFSVSIATAGVPASYTYQWYVNNTAVSGATSSSYTKSDLSITATYDVYCKVTNAAGTVQSRTATLTVTQYYTPTLNSGYPANATVAMNTSVTSKVSISTAGVPASYTYQWYKNGSAVSGATSSSYTFTPTAVGTTTLYCKVTNSAGTVTSRTATITCTAKYLYQAGQSSGWSKRAIIYSGDTRGDASGGSISYGTSSMTITGPTGNDGGTMFYNTTQVDLTNFKTLTLNGYFVGYQQYLGVWSALGSAVSDYQAAYVAGYYSEDNPPSTFTVDVSSLTGSHYIAITSRTNKYPIRIDSLTLT